MHDTLQAARELARHWRDAKGDEATGGDGRAWLIDQPGWREPMQWFDLDPPEAPVDPPPSPPEPPDDPQPETTP
jgi:hypothetical protein